MPSARFTCHTSPRDGARIACEDFAHTLPSTAASLQTTIAISVANRTILDRHHASPEIATTTATTRSESQLTQFDYVRAP